LEIDNSEIKKHEFYFGTAKVGERGQIVIPQDARDIFKINSGDLILVFGDIERGLGFMKSSKLKDFAFKLFQTFGESFEDDQEKNRGDFNEKE